MDSLSIVMYFKENKPVTINASYYDLNGGKFLKPQIFNLILKY